MKNRYLEKQKKAMQLHLDIGTQFGRQQVLDMMALVLNDPAIMGKDTFGRKRLLKVLKGIEDRIDIYQLAWAADQESDYFRAKLDDALSKIYGCDLHDSFMKRYEYMVELSYRKGPKND